MSERIQKCASDQKEPNARGSASRTRGRGPRTTTNGASIDWLALDEDAAHTHANAARMAEDTVAADQRVEGVELANQS